MKTKFDRRYPSTSGKRSQYDYDLLLSELDVSSLNFLKDTLYPKKLKEYRDNHDINEEEYFNEYKKIQQRYVMINEEVNNRVHSNQTNSDKRSRYDFFDSETGLLLGEGNVIRYSISFNEYENHYCYDNEDCNNDYDIICTNHNFVTNNKVRGQYLSIDERTRKDIYKDWNYCEEI